MDAGSTDLGALVALATKGTIALLLVAGGFCAIFWGVRLFREGVGIVPEGTRVSFKGKDFSLKVGVSSVGAALMLTASFWGFLAYLALPAYETTSGSTTVHSTTSVSSPSTPLSSGPEQGSQEELLEYVGDRVLFSAGSDVLTPTARETIEALAAWLNRNADVTLTIEGHTNEQGSREENLTLGESRAKATRDYLAILGIKGDRLTTISYGEERPAVPGSYEEAYAQNDRVEFVVD